MAWRVTGEMIESCSCNMLCPCVFGVPDLMKMDQGWCDSAIAFQVTEGESEGVNLSGNTVVLATDFPGPTMFDGNATMRLYIDDHASDDQRRELEAIFQGQRGGPLGAFAPLIARWLPSQIASIEASEDGDLMAITVGSVGVVQNRLARDMEGKSFELRGGGFVSGFGLQAMIPAPSESKWSDSEMPRSFETKSGTRGTFTWSG